MKSFKNFILEAASGKHDTLSMAKFHSHMADYHEGLHDHHSDSAGSDDEWLTSDRLRTPKQRMKHDEAAQNHWHAKEAHKLAHKAYMQGSPDAKTLSDRAIESSKYTSKHSRAVLPTHPLLGNESSKTTAVRHQAAKNMGVHPEDASVESSVGHIHMVRNLTGDHSAVHVHNSDTGTTHTNSPEWHAAREETAKIHFGDDAKHVTKAYDLRRNKLYKSYF